jgi:hypothetical protein
MDDEDKKNGAAWLTRGISLAITLWSLWAMSYRGFDPMYGTVIIGLCLVALGAIEIDSAGPIDFGGKGGKQ